MTAVDESFESLATALAEDAPSGPDLSYDADFMAMETAGAGKPERQYGDTVIPAEPPDWQEILGLARGLAERTRDLRVATWLTRAVTRQQGLAGAVAGLELVHRLLQDLWDTVHPVPDPEDGDEPVFRVSAVAPLFSTQAFIGDLRAALVAPIRGSLSVRDLELGLGLAEPRSDEAVPTREGVLQALGELEAAHPGTMDRLQRLRAAAAAVSSVLEDRVGISLSPDAKPLLVLVGGMAKVAVAGGSDGAAEGDGATSDGDVAASGAPAAVRGAAAGDIRTREDALRELERVCVWFERNEPSNPAPLLIRRAQRFVNKSFLDIMRDLAPDALEQVHRVSGTTDSD